MFGNIVLLGWPFVVAILLNKKTIPIAIMVAIIAGYLLLPEQISFDLPLLPALEKDTIPAVSLFLLIVLGLGRYKSPALRGWLPRGVIPKLLLCTLMAGAFFTTISNTDPIFYGDISLPGLKLYDAFSTVLGYLMMLLPFFLARKFLAHPEHNKALITAFVYAGVFYSFLALYEVRMSPQISIMIYGFFPASWVQHIRGDGFRPIVFLQHGLWVSMFFACTVLAAAGLARMETRGRKFKNYVFGAWLLLTLVLTKSLGALTIALMLLPCIFLLRPRLQIILCAAIALLIMAYPVLRAGEFIPVDKVVDWARSINSERAGSLEFRLDNEDQLLAKARERPFFGWAGWGRSAIFDQAGIERSTPDGYWVIILGVGGWVRYISEFGLLCAPIIIAAFKVRKNSLGMETSVIILILTANLIDLIPNATVTPLTWMLAGAVWGRLELGSAEKLNTEERGEQEESRNIRYTRFA